jgi:hypothetical protein
VAPAVGTPLTPRPPGPESPPPGWQRPAAWTSLGVGVLAAGLGAALLVGTSAAQADLDAKIAKKDATGKTVGISYAAAEEEQAALNLRGNLGWGAVALGLAVGGAGTWLLITVPEGPRVALAPCGRGLAVRVGF